MNLEFACRIRENNGHVEYLVYTGFTAPSRYAILLSCREFGIPDPRMEGEDFVVDVRQFSRERAAFESWRLDMLAQEYKNAAYSDISDVFHSVVYND